MEQVEIAFESSGCRPALEIAVNFGVVAGRQATEAEIVELAHRLVPLVGEIGIVAERRHEFGEHSEAMVERIRIELHENHAPLDAERREELIRRAADWAERILPPDFELPQGLQGAGWAAMLSERARGGRTIRD
ncbi:MAG: hypothetical protein ACXVZW_04340 [Gaiellaceae bacterium]